MCKRAVEKLKSALIHPDYGIPSTTLSYHGRPVEARILPDGFVLTFGERGKDNKFWETQQAIDSLKLRPEKGCKWCRERCKT